MVEEKKEVGRKWGYQGERRINGQGRARKGVRKGE